MKNAVKKESNKAIEKEEKKEIELSDDQIIAKYQELQRKEQEELKEYLKVFQEWCEDEGVVIFASLSRSEIENLAMKSQLNPRMQNFNIPLKIEKRKLDK